ncbi:hypothetical protein B0H63DRAFT_28959 [Podospora didyma]|uniref:Uncharacterized protein n=1 Tax=Podospora didyma TaxID=330526 RepID=A0AAE0P5H8_9PEZI|nr:hypothetical protein B0H63DRAFT_28959 [Podospora didyma]
MASYSGQSGGGGANKITKLRGKMVKPILKKVSHSEKNSLDLGRPWDQQEAEQLENHAWGRNYGSRSHSARDVSFVFSGHHIPAAGDTITSASAGANGSSVRTKFQHGRSASQASTGSGPRGAFVHPFQQTPRTSTPPLSYANSLASFDNARDCSPTITENEDDDGLDPLNTHSQTHHTHHPSHSQTNLRRPSLASQRTSSLSDITSAATPLRVTTSRSVAATPSRLAHGSLSASHSDLHLNLTANGIDSPTGSVGGTLPPPPITTAASSGSTAPMSPIRSSLEAAGFPRLRSRSELDTAARAENIRAARRKFEERERAKEEKYDREMIKKRERRDNKEATRIEQAARKSSLSNEAAVRPSISRKSTSKNLSTSSAPVIVGGDGGGGGTKGSWAARTTNSSRDDISASFLGFGSSITTSTGLISGPKRKHSDSVIEEKMSFASRKYESVPPDQSPPAFGSGVDDVRFEQARPRRGSTAKKKTQSYWQGFVLWLRTKLLRIGGGR